METGLSDMDGFSGTRVEVKLQDTLGLRLDKALSGQVPKEYALSRSRIQSLIVDGKVLNPDGVPVLNPSSKVQVAGIWLIMVPAPESSHISPQDIPLMTVYEDEDLLIVNKPAGQAVHPAPGTKDGTLVNALLFHKGECLSGIGGVVRPGIVHRIDKATSGLLVVAKNDKAHHGLADQFADHSIERSYKALVWGWPHQGDPRLAGWPGVSFESARVIKVTGAIARHKHDRKKMQVVKSGGKHAVTRFEVEKRFGSVETPFASLITCRLETGRTHQIRVHLSSIGHSLVGDQVYGKPSIGKKIPTDELKETLRWFPRQALHAETLGFRHPVTGKLLRFSADLPQDFQSLLDQVAVYQVK